MTAQKLKPFHTLHSECIGAIDVFEIEGDPRIFVKTEMVPNGEMYYDFYKGKPVILELEPWTEPVKEIITSVTVSDLTIAVVTSGACLSAIIYGFYMLPVLGALLLSLSAGFATLSVALPLIGIWWRTRGSK